MTDLDRVVLRLDTLEAIESIKQLKARYFRFVDEKRYDEFAALFVPSAKIVVQGDTWDSAADMAVAMRQLIGPSPTVHHGHMPEIEILGEDSASGIWELEDIVPFQAGQNVPGHRGYGQYRETYQKVDGRWLISSLVLTRFRMDPMDNWIPTV